MSDSPAFLKIRAASRHAALLTAIGATIAFASIIYSAVSLQDAIRQKKDLTAQILGLNSQIADAQKRLDEKAVALKQTTAEISHLEAAQSSLEARVAESEKTIAVRDTELSKVREQISQARCALAASRSAIEAFHQREYEAAIGLYSEALACDPDNAYLLNLKAYSLFKAGRIGEALTVERQSVSADPNYAWGYFDLARFLCAAGPNNFAEAKIAISNAVRLRPGLEQVMRGDGEFMRLCKGLLP